MTLPITLTAAAETPRRAHPTDAGLDLCAAETATITAGTVTLVDTGVATAIPEGHVGLIVARSSTPLKFGVTLANSVGVIDSDYRGTIKLALAALLGDVRVAAGDRLAQLVILPCALLTPVVVDGLPDTARGTGGFGSTSPARN